MNATLIRKALSEAAFNPKIPGPLASILESKNPEYFQQRAIELIRESLLANKNSDKSKSLKLAIQLLAMTQAIIKSKEPPPQKIECNEVFTVDRIDYNCSKVKGHKGRHSYYDVTTRKKYDATN